MALMACSCQPTEQRGLLGYTRSLRGAKSRCRVSLHTYLRLPSEQGAKSLCANASAHLGAQSALGIALALLKEGACVFSEFTQGP